MAGITQRMLMKPVTFTVDFNAKESSTMAFIEVPSAWWPLVWTKANDGQARRLVYGKNDGVVVAGTKQEALIAAYMAYVNSTDKALPLEEVTVEAYPFGM